MVLDVVSIVLYYIVLYYFTCKIETIYATQLY